MTVNRNIPLHRLRTCAYCADQIDTEEYGNYFKAEGWCEVRKSGGPHVTLPKALGPWACGSCIGRMRKGIAPLQQTLFEVGENLHVE